MKRWIKVLLLTGFLAVMLFSLGWPLEVGKEYYLRSTLHSVRGTEIYWVNYTDKSVPIKAGEIVKIKSIKDHIIKFEWDKKTYSFAFTEKGQKGSDSLYAKFFTEKDMKKEIKSLNKEDQSRIERGVADKGMTKEEILLAVGCPATIDGRNKTYNLTLKEIMASDSWIFYFNRFNRWLVEFKDNKVVDIKN